jgi:hypothetical protein
VSAFHSIGGCSFYLIDISFDRYPFADGWRPFRPGAPKGIPQLRYAATAGHGARRSEAHQAPARRFMARAHRRLRNFRHLTEFGTVRSSQCLPGAPLRTVAFLATRDGHGSRRASNRVRCKAQLRQIVYTDVNICIARLWLMLARPCQRRWEDPVSCALMPTCDAAFAAGHHGCALTCQAPIYLSGELEAQTLARYCLDCLDYSLSHHAVQRFLPDQPDLRPAPAILHRGIMRPLTPWPRHHHADGRPRCVSSPPRLAFQPVASDWLEPWPVSPRRCAPSCWPAPP